MWGAAVKGERESKQRHVRRAAQLSKPFGQEDCKGSVACNQQSESMKRQIPSLLAGIRLFAAIVLLVAPGCAAVGANLGGRAGEEEEAHGPLEAMPVTPEAFVDSAGGAYVFIDLDRNVLRFMYGREVIWEAPVGTGTGLRLESEDAQWEFTTPRGVFQVKFKEEQPIWYLPDWYFVEKKQPIPAENSPSRRLTGQLGVAAVYLGQEIAIHGTDRPELLGQRVSHGCIRLENRFAQRLYHNVQVGTPIVIVGGEQLARDLPQAPTTPVAPRPKPSDPLAGLPTEQLLERLNGLLKSGDSTGAWTPLASRLITRGIKDDAPALRGLLSAAGTAGSEKLNKEYATFLADVFARGALRVVVSLTRIDAPARDRATKAIVEATMRLSAVGALEDGAPWPTRRMHNGILGPEGRAGWDSLLAAEQAYRAHFTREAA